MKPPKPTYLTLVALAALLTGCGLSDPYNAQTSTPTRRTPITVSTGIVVLTPQAPPAGPRNSPQAVLYRFAQLYGNISAGRAWQRQRELERLATGPLAHQLAASKAAARVLVERAMPDGARTTGTVISAQLAPRRHHSDTGVAILQERLKTSTGVVGDATTSVFLATLTNTSRGWRVSTFQLQR